MNEELIGSYKIKNFQMGEHHFALESTSIDMKIERLSAKEDYLNNLYTR